MMKKFLFLFGTLLLPASAFAGVHTIQGDFVTFGSVTLRTLGITFPDGTQQQTAASGSGGGGGGGATSLQNGANVVGVSTFGFPGATIVTGAGIATVTWTNQIITTWNAVVTYQNFRSTGDTSIDFLKGFTSTSDARGNTFVNFRSTTDSQIANYIQANATNTNIYSTTSTWSAAQNLSTLTVRGTQGPTAFVVSPGTSDLSALYSSTYTLKPLSEVILSTFPATALGPYSLSWPGDSNGVSVSGTGSGGMSFYSGSASQFIIQNGFVSASGYYTGAQAGTASQPLYSFQTDNGMHFPGSLNARQTVLTSEGFSGIVLYQDGTVFLGSATKPILEVGPSSTTLNSSTFVIGRSTFSGTIKTTATFQMGGVDLAVYMSTMDAKIATLGSVDFTTTNIKLDALAVDTTSIKSFAAVFMSTSDARGNTFVNFRSTTDAKLTAIAVDTTSIASNFSLWLSTTQGVIKSTAANLADSVNNAINDVDNPVSWNSLKDVPAGFADGTDDMGAGGGGGGATSLQNGANVIAVSTFGFPGATIVTGAGISTVTYMPAINSTWTAFVTFASTAQAVGISTQNIQAFFAGFTSTSNARDNIFVNFRSTTDAKFDTFVNFRSTTDAALAAFVNFRSTTDAKFDTFQNFRSTTDSVITTTGNAVGALVISTTNIQNFFAGFTSTSNARDNTFVNFRSTTDAQFTTFQNFRSTTDAKFDTFVNFRSTTDSQMTTFQNFRSTGDARVNAVSADTGTLAQKIYDATNGGAVLPSTSPYRSISLPAGAWMGIGVSSSNADNNGFFKYSSYTITSRYNNIPSRFMELGNSTRTMMMSEVEMPYEWDGSSVGITVTWYSTFSVVASGNARLCAAAVGFSSAALSNMDTVFTSSVGVVSTYPGGYRVTKSPMISLTPEGGVRGGDLVKFVIFKDGGDGTNTDQSVVRVVNVTIFYRQAVWDGKPR